MTLLGGQDFGEWYERADWLLALRPGLTLASLQGLLEWQFEDVWDAVLEHEPEVRKHRGTCPLVG